MYAYEARRFKAWDIAAVDPAALALGRKLR